MVLKLDLLISWQRLAASGLAGVYLTDQGQAATRFPQERVAVSNGNPAQPPGGLPMTELPVPSLYGWDCATVWFCKPAFTTGTTHPFTLPADEHEEEYS